MCGVSLIGCAARTGGAAIACAFFCMRDRNDHTTSSSAESAARGKTTRIAAPCSMESMLVSFEPYSSASIPLGRGHRNFVLLWYVHVKKKKPTRTVGTVGPYTGLLYSSRFIDL
jgi:hypothetical protein